MTEPLSSDIAAPPADAISTPLVLAPLLFRLPLHGRRVGIFELEPVFCSAGTITRAEPLGHNAFQSHGAGMLEDTLAAMCEMLIEPNAGRATAQQARKRRRTNFERLAPQVRA